MLLKQVWPQGGRAEKAVVVGLGVMLVGLFVLVVGLGAVVVGDNLLDVDGVDVALDFVEDEIIGGDVEPERVQFPYKG
jgi:hypothetical protein